MSTHLHQSYYLSKWTCPLHGHYTARTREPRDENRRAHCPDCISIFEGCVKGNTILPVPFVTKPRWPKKEGFDRTHSAKAPFRKRGVVR